MYIYIYACRGSYINQCLGTCSMTRAFGPSSPRRRRSASEAESPSAGSASVTCSNHFFSSVIRTVARSPEFGVVWYKSRQLKVRFGRTRGGTPRPRPNRRAPAEPASPDQITFSEFDFISQNL